MASAATARATGMKITYFATPAEFRAWLERHHVAADELWVGFHKRGSGTPSITWPESVDEALCFGWIDGIRRSVDEDRYVIRFTRRRAKSIWSLINVRRVQQLSKSRRMRAAGLAAFRARDPARTGIYSAEQPARTLPPPYEKRFKANRDAWAYFQSRPPWYRRVATFWVTSAKREETRERRLEILIRDSAAGRAIGPLTRPAAAKRPRGRANAARAGIAS